MDTFLIILAVITIIAGICYFILEILSYRYRKQRMVNLKQAVYSGSIGGKHVGLHGTIESVEALEEYMERDLTTQSVEADERAVFERWVRNHFKYPNLEIDPRYPGFYADKMTAGAWEAWKEARRPQ